MWSLLMDKLLGKFFKISEWKLKSNLIVIYWQYMNGSYMPLFGNIFVLHKKTKVIK